MSMTFDEFFNYLNENIESMDISRFMNLDTKQIDALQTCFFASKRRVALEPMVIHLTEKETLLACPTCMGTEWVKHGYLCCPDCGQRIKHHNQKSTGGMVDENDFASFDDVLIHETIDDLK